MSSVTRHPQAPAGGRWLAALLVIAALGIGAAVLVQRRETEALRAEVALLQAGAREQARLEAEHRRLLAAQPPAAEVERLRNDRAALLRLQAEIEALKAKADRK
jgi:uncharacterized protein HemX